MGRARSRGSERRHFVRTWETPPTGYKGLTRGDPFHKTIVIRRGRKRLEVEVKLHLERYPDGKPAHLVVCAHPKTDIGRVIRGYGLRPMPDGRPVIPKEVVKRVRPLRDDIHTEQDVSDLPVVYDFTLR